VGIFSGVGVRRLDALRDPVAERRAQRAAAALEAAKAMTFDQCAAAFGRLRDPVARTYGLLKTTASSNAPIAAG
jgi:hypothetical protein